MLSSVNRANLFFAFINRDNLRECWKKDQSSMICLACTATEILLFSCCSSEKLSAQVVHCFALSYLSNLSMNMWHFVLLEYILWLYRKGFIICKKHILIVVLAIVLNVLLCSFSFSCIILYIFLTHFIATIRKTFSLSH